MGGEVSSILGAGDGERRTERMKVRRRAVIVGLVAPMLCITYAKTCHAETDPFKANQILVLKAQRRLFLLKDGALLRSYPIRLGPHPVGPKIFELDGRTPEGRYVIDDRNEQSDYFRSLHISYPSPEETARAAQYNLPPGDNIRIHGTPREGGRYLGDWTDGCIAVSNTAMREIWDMVDVGTTIEIQP